jgi:hypothetical protein
MLAHPYPRPTSLIGQHHLLHLGDTGIIEFDNNRGPLTLSYASNYSDVQVPTMMEVLIDSLRRQCRLSQVATA